MVCEQLCLKQGDQVILNLVFNIGHKSQSLEQDLNMYKLNSCK